MSEVASRPTAASRSSTERIVRMALCAALLAASAMLRFQIAALPVMSTAQVFMVLLVGLLLGAKDGASATALYVLIGLIGVPVFTKGGGLQTLAQPEGGYLLGFIAASGAVGALRQAPGFRARAYWDWIASFAGVVALYAVALPYVACLQWMLGSPIAVGKLMMAYGVAFWPLDAAKAVMAAIAARELLRAHPRQFARG